jgi:hypothetical protein
MSKQSEAKERQGYVAHPLSRRCRECGHLEVKKPHPHYQSADKGLTCKLGDFVVTANAVCNEFKIKEVNVN